MPQFTNNFSTENFPVPAICEAIFLLLTLYDFCGPCSITLDFLGHYKFN